MAQVEKIVRWHKAARPDPDAKALSVQIGCHLEEVAEMLWSLDYKSEKFQSKAILATRLARMVENLAADLKSGDVMAQSNDRRETLDSLCDQVVTALGIGVCAGMDMEAALGEVARSNMSKFVNGQPLFDENGKITKGPFYKAPNLDGMY